MLFSIILIFSACAQDDSLPERYTYSVPEQLNDGLQVGYLTSASISMGPVQELMNEILRGSFQEVQSVLFWRHGKLALEEYFNGLDAPRGKRIVWFENSAHMPLLEEREAFHQAMIHIVKAAIQ
jgi:pimeloyl-ACP methyl ester carboxylesterase